MSIRFKVLNGTRSGCEKSLCEHCINGQVTEGFSGKQKLIICTSNFEAAFRVEWPVASCNEFREKDSMSLTLMKEMAWHISPRVRGKVGFTPPGPDRDQREKEFVEDVIEVLKNGTS